MLLETAARFGMVTLADLQKISGVRSRSQTRNLLLKAFNKYAAQYGVTSQEDIAKFLANVNVETGGFRRLSESLNYSVDALLKKFGRHRISAADARRYGRKKGRSANQQAIANRIYGGPWGKRHLGNTEPGDGWKHRGLGPGQITGLANAKKVSKATGIDVVSDPSIMTVADVGMKVTLALWQAWDMNALSPIAGRRKWNGGTHGMKVFKEGYADAMSLNLSVPRSNKQPTPKPLPKSPAPVQSPILQRGARGDRVITLQRGLIRLGYLRLQEIILGRFGQITEGAVRQFQSENGLVVDGVAGKNTALKLSEVLKRPSRPAADFRAELVSVSNTVIKPAPQPTDPFAAEAMAEPTPEPSPVVADAAATGRFSKEKLIAVVGGATVTTSAVSEVAANVQATSNSLGDWFIPIVLTATAGFFGFLWYRRDRRQKRAIAELEKKTGNA